MVVQVGDGRRQGGDVGPQAGVLGGQFCVLHVQVIVLGGGGARRGKLAVDGLKAIFYIFLIRSMPILLANLQVVFLAVNR